jgi:hypothetical protein
MTVCVVYEWQLKTEPFVDPKLNWKVYQSEPCQALLRQK